MPLSSSRAASPTVAARPSPSQVPATQCWVFLFRLLQPARRAPSPDRATTPGLATSSYAGTAGIGGTTRIGVQNGASLTLTGTISEAVAGMSPYFRAGDSASDTITLAGTCAWTGPTRIFSNGGSVADRWQRQAANCRGLIVGPSAASLGAPTFDLAGFNQTVASLSGTAGHLQPPSKIPEVPSPP